MEEVSWLRFALASIFVLGLIGLGAFALKRFGGPLGMVNGKKARRLRVVEICPVGPKHRVVLVARDKTEHLLLIGPEGSSVVERGIGEHEST